RDTLLDERITASISEVNPPQSMKMI
ncbi:unnamed protein product, partial [Rotaria socialis]